jgi:hypothetical protein
MKKALFILCLVVLTASLAFAGGLVFQNMITKPVLEKAISEMAADIKKEYSYATGYGLLWVAGLSSRQAVFEKEMGEDYKVLYPSLAADFSNPNDYWVKERGAKQSIVLLHKIILQTARETLKKPEVLKTVYLAHKVETVSLLRKYGIANKVKAELNRMLPYFNGTLDLDTAKQCYNRLEAYQKWAKSSNDQHSVNYDELYALEVYLRHDYKLDRREFNYFEWPLRRKAEGGQPLVDMYSWIIGDMIASL